MQFVYQELSREVSDAVSHGVAVLEGACLVRYVALHDAHHLFLGYGNVGHSDTVTDVKDGYGLAVGRV